VSDGSGLDDPSLVLIATTPLRTRQIPDDEARYQRRRVPVQDRAYGRASGRGGRQTFVLHPPTSGGDLVETTGGRVDGRGKAADGR
jgi:hypothetical protein